MNEPKKMGRPRHAAPTYSAMHARIKTANGPASEHLCIGCLEPAAQWGYLGDEDDPDRLTETVVRTSADRHGYGEKVTVRVYSTNIELYAPLCRPCHAGLDRGIDCGHPEDRHRRYEFEGKYKDGSPRIGSMHQCLACKSEASKRSKLASKLAHPAYQSDEARAFLAEGAK